MSRFVRAAGIAVAALSVAAGASFAGPSLAEEADGQMTARYTDHSDRAPMLSAETLTAMDEAVVVETSALSEFSAAPVVQHAVATLEPASFTIEEEAEDEEPVRAKSLNELVNEHATSEVPDDEFECLAGAVYFESKSEPLAGQLAVAEVIINRARSGRFPASYCGVVKQRGQFSFVRGGRLPAIPRESRHWRTAVGITHVALKDLADSAAPRALFFHAKRVSPRWRLTRVASVGNHVFYR
jgi:spore germination cell wall hydrolase CwlJ-like protein